MPPTPYPPELIEAAEKEYPYAPKPKDDGDIPFTNYWNNKVDVQREAYLKGLSLAMPLREALVDALGLIREWHNMPASGKISEKEINKMWEIYFKNAPEMKSIIKALANFPQNDIINSHKH